MYVPVWISKPVVSCIEKKAMSLSVFKLFMPLFVSRRGVSPFHPASTLCSCVKALSLVGIFLLPGHASRRRPLGFVRHAFLWMRDCGEATLIGKWESLSEIHWPNGKETFTIIKIAPHKYKIFKKKSNIGWKPRLNLLFNGSLLENLI